MLGVDKYYQKRKEDKRTEIIYIVHIHVEEKKKKILGGSQCYPFGEVVSVTRGERTALH